MTVRKMSIPASILRPEKSGIYDNSVFCDVVNHPAIKVRGTMYEEIVREVIRSLGGDVQPMYRGGTVDGDFLIDGVVAECKAAVMGSNKRFNMNQIRPNQECQLYFIGLLFPNNHIKLYRISKNDLFSKLKLSPQHGRDTFTLTIPAPHTILDPYFYAECEVVEG
jgi:hypothetical protein